MDLRNYIVEQGICHGTLHTTHSSQCTARGWQLATDEAEYFYVRLFLCVRTCSLWVRTCVRTSDVICPSDLAQRKRIGPITQGSVDRNYQSLVTTHVFSWVIPPRVVMYAIGMYLQTGEKRRRSRRRNPILNLKPRRRVVIYEDQLMHRYSLIFSRTLNSCSERWLHWIKVELGLGIWN